MLPVEPFSVRLQKGLDLRGMRQIELANLTGISRGALSHYIHGDFSPNRDKISKIASVLHVNPVWLMGYDIPYQLPAEPLDDTISIPVLGTVAAGQPLYAAENILGTEMIPGSYGKDCFALQIHGGSMEPRISDGDVVIVRQQPDAESGQVVIALVGDEEATCKKFMQYEDGTIALLPFNPSFSPMVFPASRAGEVHILGIVLESRSRFA